MRLSRVDPSDNGAIKKVLHERQITSVPHVGFEVRYISDISNEAEHRPISLELTVEQVFRQLMPSCLAGTRLYHTHLAIEFSCQHVDSPTISGPQCVMLTPRRSRSLFQLMMKTVLQKSPKN